MRITMAQASQVLFVAAATTAAPAGQVEGSWEIVPSPNAPPEPLGNTLLDVAAISATDVWAVGFHHNPTYCTFCPAPLALHWDGMQWSIVDTPTIAQPKVQLNSVAALSSDDVWAVGGWLNDSCLCSGTLIEHWDGKSWSVVPSPDPGFANSLYGVAAVSSNDIWAVGDYWLNWSTKIPLILHYDGTQWTVIQYPPVSYGELASAFALAHDDVWAVGVKGVLSTGIEALSLHWDGTTWTEVPVPFEPDGYTAFYSVSGAASNDVWAVGVYKYFSFSGQQLSSARAYHWDGSSWTKVLFPGIGGQDSRFYDVHAIATDDVWAVGGQPVFGDPNIAFEYVTVHWDGASWSEANTPSGGVVYGISASSSSDAWAVGFGMDDLGYSTGTYTLHYTVDNCPADINQSGAIDINDLLAVLEEWGVCENPSICPADVNDSGAVDIVDLLVVIGSWGPC